MKTRLTRVITVISTNVLSGETWLIKILTFSQGRNIKKNGSQQKSNASFAFRKVLVSPISLLITQLGITLGPEGGEIISVIGAIWLFDLCIFSITKIITDLINICYQSKVSPDGYSVARGWCISERSRK